MTEQDPAVPMEVKGLMIDPSSNHPIVILRDKDGQLFLPIWIGVFEASAIQLQLEGVEPKRPMTHDLLCNLLQTLEAEIERIIICNLSEHTFFAEIHVRQNGRGLTIDSRPSDAIAVALRVGAPIFVRRSVLEKANAADLAAVSGDDEERLRKWFEELKPEDMGKYEM
jgi:hypothetical protein